MQLLATCGWRLLAICVDAGLLSSSEALAFCSEKVLLWGPTMGQLPVDVVIRLAERYERFVGYALLQELLQMGKVSRLPDGGCGWCGS